MALLVVIDTNVIISALLSKKDDTATVRVIENLFRGNIVPVFNQEILDEYREVMLRKKFGFPANLVDTVISTIKAYGLDVERLATDETLVDPKDLVFYEVCMAKRDKGSLLVTGNIKHFPQKPFIVTPSELIEILDKQ